MHKNISRIHSNHVDRNRFSSIRKKLCLTSNYIQLSTNIKMYNHKIKTSFFSPKVPKARAIRILYPRKAVYNTMKEITNTYILLSFGCYLMYLKFSWKFSVIRCYI